MPSEPPRREPTGADPGRRGGARQNSEPIQLRREGRGREGAGREAQDREGLRREGVRSPISDARGYTPRGRTVRESAERTRDSFRPALELVREPGARAGTRDRSPNPPRPRPAPAESARSATPTRAPASWGAAPRPAATRAGSTRTGTRTGTTRTGTTRTAGRTAAGGRSARAGGRVPPGKPPKLRRVVRRHPPRLGEPIRRLRLGAALVMALFLLLAGRLVTLQMTDAGQIARTGLASRLAKETLFAPRGTIYDANHNVLAQSVEARYVFADPSRIKAKYLDQTVIALRDLLGIPVSELMPKLTRTTRDDGSKDEFEYLKRGVSIADADKISALNIEGIGVGRDEIRVQPGNDLAANLIGYTGADGLGKQGLESSEDSLLAGVDGQRTYEVGNGALGTQIPGGYEEVKAAHPGSSVQLTVDRDVQFMAQQILLQQMTKVNAAWACAVVLDIKTGDIRAQASYPTYSAANPDGSTAAQQTDNCSQTVADPGSVHKVVTLGAALQTGYLTANSTVPVCPTINRGGTTFRDTHPLNCGTRLTIPGILAYSSNVGAITVGSLMGDKEPQIIYDYQRLYGLGSATNEGMPNEAPGLLQKPDGWSGSSYGSVPIGDGVSATPLQMAAVYATIANNGVYVTPRLIDSTIAADGTVTQCPASATHQVLSAQNAGILRQDLEAVLTVPGGTGHSAAIPGYRVAGKTGTGQFVGPDGTYLPGTVASFIGMAPADAPRYVVAIFAYTPGGDEGGKAAAPAFKDLMSFTLGHYHVPPTGTNSPTFVTTG